MFTFDKGQEWMIYFEESDSAGNSETKTNVPDISLLVNTTSIGNMVSQQESVMQVIPNPSDEATGVKVALDLTPEAMQDAKLVVLGVDGRTIRSIPVISKEFTVSGLGQGIYIFMLKTAQNQSVNQKVIIQ